MLWSHGKQSSPLSSRSTAPSTYQSMLLFLQRLTSWPICKLHHPCVGSTSPLIPFFTRLHSDVSLCCGPTVGNLHRCRVGQQHRLHTRVALRAVVPSMTDGRTSWPIRKLHHVLNQSPRSNLRPVPPLTRQTTSPVFYGRFRLVGRSNAVRLTTILTSL